MGYTPPDAKNITLQGKPDYTPDLYTDVHLQFVLETHKLVGESFLIADSCCLIHNREDELAVGALPVSLQSTLTSSQALALGEQPAWIRLGAQEAIALWEAQALEGELFGADSTALGEEPTSLWSDVFAQDGLSLAEVLWSHADLVGDDSLVVGELSFLSALLTKADAFAQQEWVDALHSRLGRTDEIQLIETQLLRAWLASAAGLGISELRGLTARLSPEDSFGLLEAQWSQGKLSRTDVIELVELTSRLYTTLSRGDLFFLEELQNLVSSLFAEDGIVLRDLSSLQAFIEVLGDTLFLESSEQFPARLLDREDFLHLWERITGRVLSLSEGLPLREKVDGFSARQSAAEDLELLESFYRFLTAVGRIYADERFALTGLPEGRPADVGMSKPEAPPPARRKIVVPTMEEVK